MYVFWLISTELLNYRSMTDATAAITKRYCQTAYKQNEINYLESGLISIKQLKRSELEIATLTPHSILPT